MSDTLKLSVGEIATQTATHRRKVARLLEFSGADPELKKRVQKGTMSMNVALELAGMEQKIRSQVLPQVTDGMSATELRKIAKGIAKGDSESAKATPGKPGNRQKNKIAKTAVAYTWRGNRERQELLRQLCYMYVNPESAEDRGDYVRAMIGTLFWSRGDIDVNELVAFPDFYHGGADTIQVKPPTDSPAKGKYKDHLQLVKGEAAQYTPPATDTPAEATDTAKAE
jgi:hypothetical protein